MINLYVLVVNFHFIAFVILTIDSKFEIKVIVAVIFSIKHMIAINIDPDDTGVSVVLNVIVDPFVVNIFKEYF